MKVLVILTLSLISSQNIHAEEAKNLNASKKTKAKSKDKAGDRGAKKSFPLEQHIRNTLSRFKES